MNYDYIKYAEFYHSHEAIIEDIDKEYYRTLKVRHIISIAVGFSLSPISYQASKRFINLFPPSISMLLSFIAISGPIVTASYFARKYLVFPHLEYIYNKYSLKDQDFDYLIDKTESN